MSDGMELQSVVVDREDQGISEHAASLNNKRTRKYVINPEASDFLRRWDLAMTVALGYVCFVTPFEVAFLMDMKPDNYLVTGADGLFWLNRTVDLFFVVDIVLQFFIMYGVANKYGVTYVQQHSLIVKHYLTTWFTLDVFSILPFDVLGVAMGSEALAKLRMLQAVRLVRLFKLARLLRGMRIFHRLELEMSFSYRKVTLWQLFVTVMIAAHWISCLLGLISNLQGRICFGDEQKEDCAVTWLSPAATEIVAAGSDFTAARAYLVALHVTSTILVHPHSASPTSDAERFFFIVFVFLGGFVWTRVISRSTAVQTSLDRHNIHYRQTMDDLNLTADEMNLSKKLRKRMRGFFLNTKNCSQQNTWTDLIKRMSPAMQAEVARDVHRNWLYQVSYLWGLPRLFIKDLAQVITMNHFAQNEVFGENFTLYIMHRGLSSKSTMKRLGIQILRPGSVWGDEHMLLNAWWLLEPNTARALSFAEVMTLKRQDFEGVCERHPQTLTKFRKFFVKYAVINGVIYAAKQEKQKQNGVLAKCSLLSGTGTPTGRCISKDTDGTSSDSFYDAAEFAHHRFLARRGTDGWGEEQSLQDLSSPQHCYTPNGRQATPQATPTARGVACGSSSSASDLHAMEERLSQKIENLEKKSASDAAQLAAQVNKLRIAVDTLLAQLACQSHPHSPCSFEDNTVS